MKIFITTILSFMLSANIVSQNEQIENLFTEFSGKCPGASVLVVKNGKILFQNGFGHANLEDKIKVESNTNFRLASVTKEFTAASILILVQKGFIGLQTKLSDIFKNFPQYGNQITVNHLLTHTSGLVDYEDLIPDSVTVQVKDADVLKMISEQKTTYFEPGSQYKYSNTGYALLALIVEKISGQRFADFLKYNIFEPLEMNNTIAHEEGISMIKNRAFGYERIDRGWVRKDQSITSAVLGDGGIYSNVEDLFKWDRSLNSNKILSDDLRKASMTRAELNNGEKIDYGYGWHLKSFNGCEIIFHGGSTQGFRNVIYRVPSKQLTVIILTNRNEGEPEKIADMIFEIFENTK